MPTLKELHEQVGKLPMKAKRKYWQDDSYVIWEAQLSNGRYVGLNTYEDTVTCKTFGDNHDDWQLVHEKKKALAYVHVDGGVSFVVDRSKAHETMKTNCWFTRQECFDIESGDV